MDEAENKVPSTRCLRIDVGIEKHTVSSSASKILGLEIKCPSLHDRSQSEMWHGSLGMETMTSWRIHLKCLHSAIVAFDPIGIYLWHTLAAESH